VKFINIKKAKFKNKS